MFDILDSLLYEDFSAEAQSIFAHYKDAKPEK
jgi:hypothetical protein